MMWLFLNFANCDMVGHTGVFEAAVSAVEAVDTCLGKVVDKILSMGPGTDYSGPRKCGSNV